MNRIPLLPLALISALLLLTLNFRPSPTTALRLNPPPISFSLLPVNTSNSPASKVPNLSAFSAVIIDAQSGVTLFEKNADLAVYPASTTKMITALLMLENLNLMQVVEVPEIKVDTQVMKLFKGEKITVRDLLYGTLVWSANDAAEVLASDFPGGRENFILQMNKRAKELGMKNSKFKNPTGLTEAGHFSTARDLATFARFAMKNPEFAQIVRTQETTVFSVDGRTRHKLVNLNELLGKVQGVLGIKTGWTEDSGGALVTYVERENHPLVIVILDSQDRFGDSKKLIEWAYKNFKWNSLQSYLP